MAYTGTFCTEADIDSKSGKDVAPEVTEDMKNSWAAMTEASINTVSRFNFTDVYDTLNIDTRGILTDVSSSLIAIYAITYDLNSYPSRIQAEDMINIHRDAALRGLSLLRDKKVEDFITNA